MAIVCAALANGCVTTYRDFPRKMVGRPPGSKPFGVLHYHVKNFPVLSGGYSALNTAFQSRSPFRETVRAEQAPAKGIYCLVDVKWKPLTPAAIVWGYISLAFLTIIPSWSTREGFLVDYRLFVDGRERKTYSYEITRKGFLWIVLLPFVWANLLTYSEADAFEATAYQFFKDAEPVFSSSR